MNVDLVYTWVNPEDEELNQLRAFHKGIVVDQNSSYNSGQARYQNNGELICSLRSAMKYAPFFRKIFVVTAGKRPDWFPNASDKLVYVNQNDVIPAQYTPIFQSDCVEAFLYLIPDLSEHYVYSNDDYFFSTDLSENDFFDLSGRPIIGISRRPAAARWLNTTYRAMEANAVKALREKIRLRPSLKVSSPEGLFAYRGGLKSIIKRIYNNINFVNTMSHVAQPYLKSHWADFHGLFHSEINKMCSSKFRSEDGLTINMMYHHYIRSLGKAIFEIDDNSIFIDRGDTIETREALRIRLLRDSRTVKRFCLNDCPTEHEDNWQEFIADLLRHFLPDQNMSNIDHLREALNRK